MMKLYLDLDGVFADFDARVMEICGQHYKSDPELWKKLQKVDHLFYNLDPLPYAKRLYGALKDVKQKEFLTALPMLTEKLVTAPDDKKLWVKENLDPSVYVNCVSSWRQKARFASPRAILIDDFERNIKAWREAGGIGILHTDPDKTLEELKPYMDRLTENT